jgi:tRNA(Ile)-lysidine synthase TilS/MesJ
LSQELANSTNLRSVFPKANLGALDFEKRLMHYHIRHLPRADEKTRARVLNQLKPFLEKHWQAIERSVSPSTLSTYGAILRGENESAIALIELKAQLLEMKEKLAATKAKSKKKKKKPSS